MSRFDVIDYSALGARVRARRRQMGLTQRQLAERIDTTAAFISILELGGRAPSLDTLARLCAVLEVSMEYLALGRRAVPGDNR